MVKLTSYLLGELIGYILPKKNWKNFCVPGKSSGFIKDLTRLETNFTLATWWDCENIASGRTSDMKLFSSSVTALARRETRPERRKREKNSSPKKNCVLMQKIILPRQKK